MRLGGGIETKRGGGGPAGLVLGSTALGDWRDAADVMRRAMVWF